MTMNPEEADTLQRERERELDSAAALLRPMLETARTVIIAGEPSPDADCCGSQVALAKIARQLKPEVRTVLVNERGCPERYRWLDGTREMRLPPRSEPACDLAIVVDGGVERCGPKTRALVAASPRTVLIDHHLVGSREHYDIALVDPTRASTTELIHMLVRRWELELDPGLAEALYLGLVADTNSFQFSSTSSSCLRVAAELVEAGARSSFISEKVMLERPFDFMRLQTRVYERMRRLCHGRMLLAFVHTEDLAGLDLPDPHLELLLGSLSFIEGVEITAMVRSIGAGVGQGWRRLSLRSRGGVNVAEVARRLDPEGGGHARAAGCRLRGSDQEIERRLLLELEPALRRS